MGTPEIPVVRWPNLVDDGVEAQVEVARAIAAGFAHVGIVYVSDHPVARPEVLALYDQFLRVLERPRREKERWGGADIWFQRGWTPPNTERAVLSSGRADFKECFFAAPEPVDPYCAECFPEIYADNVWPDDASEFRQAMLEVGHALHGVGAALLRACEGALSVAPTSLTGPAEGAAHVTRLLKYLPVPEEAGADVLWGEEHTDFNLLNLLTLLPGGCFYRGRRAERGVSEADRGGPTDSGGLFLRTRPTASHPRGQRIAGTPPPGCLVAQVGQQLEILSGGRFLATPHGVEAPGEPGWTRTSIAHFVHLQARQRVEPLPTLREGARGYLPPVLAGTYATKTLVDIGLAPSAALDHLGYRSSARSR